MKSVCLTVLLFCVSAVSAEQFSLKSSAGEVTGPYRLEEGIEVKVGESLATITDIKRREDAVLSAMEEIIIPQIDFRSASVVDAIDFLQRASRQFDKKGRGVNLVLNLNLDLPAVAAVGDDPFAEPEPVKNVQAPTVTFMARHVTLLEALKIITQISNLKYRVMGGVVVVMPWDAPEGSIIRRVYDVLPPVEDKISIVPSELGGEHSNNDTYSERGPDWKGFFADMGVRWPAGSSIKYVRSIGKMIVDNTEENLKALELCLAMVNVSPTQVEIEVLFIAFDVAHIEELGRKSIAAAALWELWEAGHGELIAAPKTVTKSGNESQVKGVKEYIYPTEFSVQHAGSTNTNAVVVAGLVEPASFETREVGVILSVLPEVAYQGDMINVNLTPEVVGAPEWHEFGGEYLDANGQRQQAHMPQPIFRSYSCNTSVGVKNGHRILIGGGMPSRDGKQMVYAFLTAKLIDIEGNDVERDAQQKLNELNKRRATGAQALR